MMDRRNALSTGAAERLQTELVRLASEINALSDKSARADQVAVHDLAVRLKTISTLIPVDDRASRLRLNKLRRVLEGHIRRLSISAATRPRRVASPPAGADTPPGRADERVELALALHDPFSTDIAIVCRRDGRERRIDVERVLTRKPACIAWLIVDTTEFASRLECTGWTLWRPDWPVESRKRKGVVGADQLPIHRVLVATLRGHEIPEFARLATRRCLQIADSETCLAVRADQCAGEEYRRRNDALETSRRLRATARSADRGPRLGTCAGCGRPLTDPISARRGYGPVCCGKATGTPRQAAIGGNVATAYAVAGISIDDWQQRLRRALAMACAG